VQQTLTIPTTENPTAKNVQSTLEQTTESVQSPSKTANANQNHTSTPNPSNAHRVPLALFAMELAVLLSKKDTGKHKHRLAMLHTNVFQQVHAKAETTHAKSDTQARFVVFVKMDMRQLVSNVCSVQSNK